MDAVVYIIGFVLGIAIFAFLNSVFDIYYFGFKGMAGTFMGCWFGGILIVMLFGAIAKWLIIIFVILWIISKIAKAGKDNQKN